MTFSHFFYELLPFLCLGAITGCFAGLLGLGGGTIVVAGLLIIFKYGAVSVVEHPMHTAAATSLTVMVITTLSSFLAHWHLGTVHIYTYKRMIKGILVGVIAGVGCGIYLSGAILEKIFALLLIGMSIYMFVKNSKPKRPRKTYAENEVPKGLLEGVGLLIAIKSGLLGVGGGLITVPFLRHTHLKMRQAIGTSSAISLSIAVAGTTSYLVLPHIIHISIMENAYIYWPAVLGIGLSSMICAPLGAWLSSRTPTRLLTTVFAVLLLLVGLDTLFKF